ncbi:uncharacterized [Tachysurus ichikawai]
MWNESAQESSLSRRSYGRFVCLCSSRLHFICKAESRSGAVSGLKHIPPHITQSDNSSRSEAKRTAALSLKHNALSAPLNTSLCVKARTEEGIKKNTHKCCCLFWFTQREKSFKWPRSISPFTLKCTTANRAAY